MSRWLTVILAMASIGSVAGEAVPENTLRWKARDEAGTYGYLIYRSEQATGPFRRINPKIVPKQSGADAGYVFVDRDVKAGATYYYRIDGVSNAGIKKPLSPVLPKTVGEKTAGR